MIDLSEILKNVPQGTQLYCTIYGNVEFVKIGVYNNNIVIRIFDLKGNPRDYLLSRYGTVLEYDSECVLWPSKDERDWSNFKVQYKVGEIVSFICQEATDSTTSTYGVIHKVTVGKNAEYTVHYIKADGSLGCVTFNADDLTVINGADLCAPLKYFRENNYTLSDTGDSLVAISQHSYPEWRHINIKKPRYLTRVLVLSRGSVYDCINLSRTGVRFYCEEKQSYIGTENSDMYWQYFPNDLV